MKHKCDRCTRPFTNKGLIYEYRTKSIGKVEVKLCGPCCANFIHVILLNNLISYKDLTNYANRHTELVTNKNET